MLEAIARLLRKPVAVQKQETVLVDEVAVHTENFFRESHLISAYGLCGPLANIARGIVLQYFTDRARNVAVSPFDAEEGMALARSNSRLIDEAYEAISRDFSAEAAAEVKRLIAVGVEVPISLYSPDHGPLFREMHAEISAHHQLLLGNDRFMVIRDHYMPK